MEQFEKWSRMTETTFPKTVYTERKKAWKAALEMVLKHRKPYYDSEDKKVVATDSDIIYKELDATK